MLSGSCAVSCTSYKHRPSACHGDHSQDLSPEKPGVKANLTGCTLVNRVISIVLADDHALVRGMLTNRLSEEPDLRVVASVGNAEEAAAEALRLKPDIVLMDIDMPGTLCFEAARMIRQQSPDSRVIFLGCSCRDQHIEPALSVRAWGYITKAESAETVVDAIRSVSSGTAYFSPDVEPRIVVDANGAHLARNGLSRVSTLSDRERVVLQYVARGLSQKQIAKVMYISPNTVNRHCNNLMAKLDIHDRVELTRFAIREGLVEV